MHMGAKYGIVFLSRTAVHRERTEKTCGEALPCTLEKPAAAGAEGVRPQGKAAVSLRQKDRAIVFAQWGAAGNAARPGCGK